MAGLGQTGCQIRTAGTSHTGPTLLKHTVCRGAGVLPWGFGTHEQEKLGTPTPLGSGEASGSFSSGRWGAGQQGVLQKTAPQPPKGAREEATGRARPRGPL